MDFYFEIIAFAITLAGIFVALKWKHISWLPETLKQRKMLPLVLLLTVIVVDALVYVFVDYTGAMYLMIMTVLALPFTIHPKKKE